MWKQMLTTANPFYRKIMQLYERYQRFLPVASFLAGFGWDSLTLARIDLLIDNLTLLVYLIFLGISITLQHLTEHRILKARLWYKFQEWYPLAIQFFLGGLFSAYVVYYFQSASVGKSLIFVGLLVTLMVANEFLENRLTNIYLQMGLYFFAAFSFFIFFLPVITRMMNWGMFLAGGLLSLMLVEGELYLLWRKAALKSREQFVRVTTLVGGVFLLLNVLYATNWIPPVPLSLKYGGIFHSVIRVEDRYRVKYEKPRWYQFFKDSDDVFHFGPGDKVFCFTAVFAPTQLKTRILHVWQYYSPRRKKWVTTDRISYPIIGGRDGGYRGVSFKRNVREGHWRVDVVTEEGLLLGRISFEVVKVTEPEYELVTEFR